MELIIAVSILGLLAFLLPILLHLFNSLGYLQQRSLIQKDAKAALWQISHDVTNAVHVDTVDPNNINLPPPDCAAGVAKGECMVVWVYDFNRYEGAGGDFENPDMYKIVGNNKKLTYGQIIYEVVPGSGNTKPYLSRRTLWLGSPTPPETTSFLQGRIIPNGSVPTFVDYGSNQQFFKVTLRLKSTYDKPTDPPRYFSAAVTMAAPAVW